ncbi:uncharacterized protein SAPINGB_P001832 [Magnusiomyces paraingens]|uniref:Centromere protein H C-terminal domain-containing protein n=1 Tax=Magnusiomyces paraingens TaxID=2606893 RepID=A0A5E8BCW1_9ASCO|nr:uncharacterized protein SAPINGB_P001832 [Saprochaete ingens]VVT48547.1 unnamed protein product [Saprochaete ingens]
MSSSTKGSTSSDMETLRKASAQVSNLDSFEFGVPSVKAATSVLTPEEQELVELQDKIENLSLPILALDEIRKLKQGVNVLNRDVQFSTDDSLVNAEEEEKFLLELDQEIEALIHKNKLRYLTLENLLATIPVKDAIYSTSTVRQSSLLPLLEKRDELEQETLKLSDEIASLDEKYEHLLTKVHAKHDATKEFLSKLCKAKEAQKRSFRKIPQRDREKYNLILQEITLHRKKVAILSEVISLLISESGIDWASSEELTEILLSCGTNNLDTLEQEDMETLLTTN